MHKFVTAFQNEDKLKSFIDYAPSIITISLNRYVHSQTISSLKSIKNSYIKTFNLPAKTITTFPHYILNNISNLSQLKEKYNIYKNLDSNSKLYI